MSKEKVRIGFQGRFEDKLVEVADGDPAPWDPSRKFSILGARTPRLDGRAKATGAARYSIDVVLPGMLYGWRGRILAGLGFVFVAFAGRRKPSES